MGAQRRSARGGAAHDRGASRSSAAGWRASPRRSTAPTRAPRSRCSRCARAWAAPPTRSSATASSSTTASTSSCAAARPTARCWTGSAARAHVAAGPPGHPRARARPPPRGCAAARLPAPLHLAGALARYGPARRGRPARALARAMLALRASTPTIRRRRAHVRRLAGRAPPVPARVEAIWELIALPTLNLPAGEASLAQAAYVFRTGLLDDAAAGDIGWLGVPLSELHDGPARRALRPPAPTCAPARAAQRVEHAGAGRLAVAGADGRPWTPTRSSSPCPTARGRRAARGRARRAAARSSASALPDRQRPRPLRPPGDRRAVRRRRRLPGPVGLRPHRRSAGSPTASTWRSRCRPPTRARTSTRRAARRASCPRWPSCCPARARAPASSASPCTASTPRRSARRPAPRALRPGPRARGCPGSRWPGAWTDTGWPATMEGAVRSGHAAAARWRSRGAPAARRVEVTGMSGQRRRASS